MSRTFTALALCAFSGLSSAQDLTITYKVTDGGTSTHYFAKDRIRVNSGRSDTIMEFATGKITTIDHQKKEYSEMTVAEIDETMKNMNAQLEQMLSQAPPQMREQMAKMMGGGGGGGAVEVTKGTVKTIAGLSCQSYTIAMGAGMTQETCNTTALTPPFDAVSLQKMSRMTVPMIQGMDKLVAKTSEIQGIPLLTRTTVNIMGNKTDNGMEATDVKRGPIADGVFAMPSGYKQVDSPLKKMPKMGR